MPEPRRGAIDGKKPLLVLMLTDRGRKVRAVLDADEKWVVPSSPLLAAILEAMWAIYPKPAGWAPPVHPEFGEHVAGLKRFAPARLIEVNTYRFDPRAVY